MTPDWHQGPQIEQIYHGVQQAWSLAEAALVCCNLHYLCPLGSQLGARYGVLPLVTSDRWLLMRLTRLIARMSERPLCYLWL